MFSIHFLTLEPRRIIRQIEAKEEKAVENYNYWQNGIEVFRDCLESSLPNLISHKPNINDALEKVVVKSWKNIISAYPIAKTPYQVENLTWLIHKTDTHKNSITQKYGSIIACWEAELLRIGFLVKGNAVSETELSIVPADTASENYTLQKCIPQNMLKSILQTDVAKQTDGFNLDIPIFLPMAWESSWTILKETQFTSFCE